jgi:hypothetical protein
VKKQKQGVSTSELAEWLTVVPKHVLELTKEGVLSRIGRTKTYDLKSNVIAYIRYTRKRVSGTIRDDFIQEKQATQSIIRQQKEIELAKARGELINREHALLVLTNAVAVMKNHVLAIASRCSRRVLGLKSQVEVHAVIRPACENSLSEIANIDVEQLVEQSFRQGTNGKHDLSRRKTRAD